MSLATMPPVGSSIRKARGAAKTTSVPMGSR